MDDLPPEFLLQAHEIFRKAKEDNMLSSVLSEILDASAIVLVFIDQDGVWRQSGTSISATFNGHDIDDLVTDLDNAIDDRLAIAGAEAKPTTEFS